MLWFLTLGALTLCIPVLLILFYWFSIPIIVARSNDKNFKQGFHHPSEKSFHDPNTNRNYDFPCISESPSCDLSLIVPAYNEQERITKMLEETIHFLEKRAREKRDFTYEVIVVDDGSEDNTARVVMEFASRHKRGIVKLLKLHQNHGKGGAVRKGMLKASGRLLLMVDADGATNINDLPKLEREVAEYDKGNGIICCGSRAHLENEAIAKRSPLRNFLMHGFHFLVSSLCVNNVRDTQCGFKLFDRKAAQLVFPPMHIERWSFDVEVLFVASKIGITIREVAVEWQEIPGSKLSVLTASLTMLRELFLIRFCYSSGIWTVEDGGYRLSKI